MGEINGGGEFIFVFFFQENFGLTWRKTNFLLYPPPQRLKNLLSADWLDKKLPNAVVGGKVRAKMTHSQDTATKTTKKRQLFHKMFENSNENNASHSPHMKIS